MVMGMPLLASHVHTNLYGPVWNEAIIPGLRIPANSSADGRHVAAHSILCVSSMAIRA